MTEGRSVLICVDPNKLERHLEILQDELRETRIILDLLKTIFEKTNRPEILRHIRTMEDERRRIMERYRVLEQAAHLFREAGCVSSHDLEYALYVLGQNDNF